MSDLRETIEAAVEQHSSPEPTPEPAPVAEVAAPEPSAEPSAPQPAPSSGRARDDLGRFAPKSKDAPEGAAAAPAKPVAAEGMKPAAVSPAAVGSPDGKIGPKGSMADAAVTPMSDLKPPAQWKPTEREVWAKIPREAQEAIVRRANEDRLAIQKHGEAAKFREEFEATFRPFEGFMAAAGHTPMESLRSLAQTAAALQTAPPAHKAQIVAQIISGYGVDLNALNAALQGQPAPQQQAQHFDPAQIAHEVRQSLMSDLQAQREQKLATEWETKVQGYAEKFEFFDDVREDVADMVAAWSKRNPGKLPSDSEVERWYNHAVALNPSTAPVVEQRKAFQAAQAQIASTQRSKAAGSSIKAIPAASVTRNTGPRSLREDIEAAVAAQRA